MRPRVARSRRWAARPRSATAVMSRPPTAPPSRPKWWASPASALYLMPTGDPHGLGPNARVVPRQRAGTVAVGPQLLGRIIDGAAQPLDGLGPLNCEQTRAPHRCAHESAGTTADLAVAGRGRAHHQQPADRRARPAHRPVRRQRRGQERAAGHDGPLHQRRCDRRRPDRRARPRSEGIRRPHSRARRTASARWSWRRPRIPRR